MRIRYALHNDDTRFQLAKAHHDDACYDLVARCFAGPEDLSAELDRYVLPPLSRCLARTGVYLELESGWEALVRPRSGNAIKKGLTILNTPGTVDAGYRNEIAVILYNASEAPLELVPGLKVAQMAFRRIPEHEVEAISRADFDADTARNLKGFGSSGE